MTPEKRLEQLGLTLPKTPPAVGNYLSAVLQGDLLFVSGHGPYQDGHYVYLGKVDSAVSVEIAQKAARLTMLNALGSVRDALGSLDRVAQVVKVLGMVNSDPGFGMQPKIIDGASDLLVEIFGEAGRHARSAVGLGALPMGICVEIEMVVAVKH